MGDCQTVYKKYAYLIALLSKNLSPAVNVKQRFDRIHKFKNSTLTMCSAEKNVKIETYEHYIVETLNLATNNNIVKEENIIKSTKNSLPFLFPVETPTSPDQCKRLVQLLGIGDICINLQKPDDNLRQRLQQSLQQNVIKYIACETDEQNLAFRLMAMFLDFEWLETFCKEPIIEDSNGQIFFTEDFVSNLLSLKIKIDTSDWIHILYNWILDNSTSNLHAMFPMITRSLLVVSDNPVSTLTTIQESILKITPSVDKHPDYMAIVKLIQERLGIHSVVQNPAKQTIKATNQQSTTPFSGNFKIV